MPRHYTDEEKRLVLDRLIANHGDVARTASETGVSDRAIYSWRREPQFADLISPLLPHLPPVAQNSDLPPSPDASGEGPGLGVSALPPETTQAFQSLHDKLLAIADTLSNSIEEAIPESPLNQRVAAISQIMNTISKIAAQLPQTEEQIEYVYKYKVAHHVEKEDDNEQEDHHDYGSGDRTGNPSAETPHQSEESISE